MTRILTFDLTKEQFDWQVIIVMDDCFSHTSPDNSGTTQDKVIINKLSDTQTVGFSIFNASLGRIQIFLAFVFLFVNATVC